MTGTRRFECFSLFSFLLPLERRRRLVFPRRRLLGFQVKLALLLLFFLPSTDTSQHASKRIFSVFLLQRSQRISALPRLLFLPSFGAENVEREYCLPGPFFLSAGAVRDSLSLPFPLQAEDHSTEGRVSFSFSLRSCEMSRGPSSFPPSFFR